MKSRSPLSHVPGLHAARLALLGAALALSAGCGADAPDPVDPCADLLSECLSSQKACVVQGSSAQCEACPGGQYVTAEGRCEAIGGTPLTHDFEEFSIKAGEEIKGLCQSWTLNNAEELWVNAVELQQDQRSHHSIWTFVPQDQFEGPDGVWPCADRNYNELLGTLAGGVLYAQSTQAESEVQRFPTGSAVRIPPYSKIIGDVHLLNTTPEDVTGHARLTLHSIPGSEVAVSLVPFQMAYRDLMIPPHAKSRFGMECDLRNTFETTANEPFDIKIHYILPHTHQYATRLYVDVHGGPNDGRNIIDVAGYKEEARGRFLEPAIDMTGAAGISFGCEYDNPGDATLGWAYEEEMCQLLGFAESKVAFLAAVWESTQGPSEGDMQTFTGPCDYTAVPWNFDKPGGTPQ